MGTSQTTVAPSVYPIQCVTYQPPMVALQGVLPR